MERREFLKTCAAGAAIGVTSLSAAEAVQEEATNNWSIDVDKLCAAAYQHFIPGKRTCSESVLTAGCDALGIKSDLVPDIALGLAAGVGLQGDTCGVLTGCALVVSLAVAQKENEYPKKKMKTFETVGRIHKRFKERFGKTDCRALSGLDLTTAEGRKRLQEQVKEQTCTKYVQAGCELLAKELANL